MTDLFLAKPLETIIITIHAPIAQLDRASDYGSEGWKFKSSWAQLFRCNYCENPKALYYLQQVFLS
jgi:hypothetical protein